MNKTEHYQFKLFHGKIKIKKKFKIQFKINRF